MTDAAFAEIAVTLPVRGRFHYLVPENLQGQLQVGHRVLVPFGPRRVTGFVVALVDALEPDVVDRLKPIASRMDEAPLVPPDILRLATFCAEYYLSTVGEVLKAALPPGLTAASVQRLVATAAGRRWLAEDRALSDAAVLTKAQSSLLERAARGQGVKGEPVRSKSADALEQLGLAVRKDGLDARDTEETVAVARRVADPATAWPHIRRAPLRRELYQRLEDGPVAVETLVAALGGGSVRRGLKSLVEAEVVAIDEVDPATLGPGPALAAGTETPPELTEEQGEALAELLDAYDAPEHPFLLEGVTGSGKTEVYLRLIAHARALGHGAVVLVPEIALTPQLAARFEARFGGEVVVLHSALTDAQRRDNWRRLHRGEAHIALGPRSALWAPVRDLRVIVVDEEHDPSFKQSTDVRYNGRDLALVRAREAGALVVLGSATPALETLQMVARGRAARLVLARRVGDRPMPTMQVVDLAEERRQRKGDVHLISRALADGLRDTVAKGEQAILFLNRRGFNTIVYCEDCGAAKTCPRCSVSLTHHRHSGKLACHYCGFEERLESKCRECGGRAIRPMGAGTERVVAAVEEEAPGARVLRLDRDVTSKAGGLQSTLRAFRNREADVLVGTQMVAKGHDFPDVTLVGIVLADASLAFPDFRAAERTFQLLTQVAGRAGRAERPGRVVVQTFQPDHYALQAALRHDVHEFFRIETASRQDLGYPPFGRLGLIRIESKDARAAERTASEVAQRVSAHDTAGALRVLGPSPAPIERLRERWRFRVLVVASRPAPVVAALSAVRAQIEPPRKVDVLFDVDPLDLL